LRALEVTIGRLASNLDKKGIGGGTLGNLVADAIKSRAESVLGHPIVLAITNRGGLRKNDIAVGELRAMDVYELLPFENALIALDLSGEQLKRLLDVMVGNGEAAQAGAHIKFRTNAEKKNEIERLRLVGPGGVEKELDPQATYTVVTIDYLVKRGGQYAVLQQAKNQRPLNLTIRDAVLDYVKAETAAGRAITVTLDGRYDFDKQNSVLKEGEQPQ
jgi:2',3'-cyclic-nucleotide 2'-phosphodiesterase (5'-nucleotidase family)